MAGFLRKVFGCKQTKQSRSDNTDLEKFYTDAEHVRQIFERMITSQSLSKYVLVIHGIGGVGKSTLLKMYMLTCHKRHISVALAAGEENPSPVDVLAKWADDLTHNEVSLPAFQKTLNHYHAIQAKVEEEAKKSSKAASQFAGKMGKAAAKATVGIALSFIPIVGPIAGALGGESTEAFVDWLRGFLSKPDVELYLDPKGRLDNDFLHDLSRLSSQQRIVLMADTYEQMTAMDAWMRELTRRLPENVLLVISGRKVPEWNRTWQDWLGKAEVVELKEMTTGDLSILIQRYYAYIHSRDPDPQQVEAIARFARGLPMVATTVVQLWLKYGLEDFQAVRPQVVADLVDRLLEGVPQETRPVFEASAVLRYFNAEALGVVLDDSNVENIYAELRRWPYIRSRKEGLAVHSTMREMINEAIHVRRPKYFRTLHERALAYYDVQLEKSKSEEREQYAFERLYHQVLTDELKGIELFQELAEELVRYRLVNRLRALLNDVNTYPLESENSKLWREYYNARLAQFDSRISYAEEMYQAIGENKHVELKLRAYTLCDLGGILCRTERLHQPGVVETAIKTLESSLRLGSLGVPTDVKLAMSWVHLGRIYAAQANWEKALLSFDHARTFFTERSDFSGLITVLEEERAVYWGQGNLKQTLDVEKKMMNIYIEAKEPPSLRMRIPPTWEWAWMGRYAESEKEIRRALEIAKSSQDQEYLCRRTRDLALYLGFQGKCPEAQVNAEESLSLAQSFGTAGGTDLFCSLTHYGIVSFKCGELDRAEDYLTQAYHVLQNVHARLDIVPLYLAILHEVRRNFDEAEPRYQRLLKGTHPSGRNYEECGALTGLVRVKHNQNDYPTLLSYWSEAKRLAEQNEYNDFLASLYLSRGHITWDGPIPDWGSGFDIALQNYKLALIHALRFNRFLLDEVLSGSESCTPLLPIIPHCVKRGKEGELMLVALSTWWKSGVNDTGMPSPDKSSLVPEGLSLVKAERSARQGEPGNGSEQKSVVKQINLALQ
jgi:tetratricopeptide (TPR) repeat protein